MRAYQKRILDKIIAYDGSCDFMLLSDCDNCPLYDVSAQRCPATRQETVIKAQSFLIEEAILG